MNRLLTALCFILFISSRLFAGQIVAIDDMSTEMLLGGAENVKIVADAKEVSVFRVQNHSEVEVIKNLDTLDKAIQLGPASPVSGPAQKNVVDTLSNPAGFGVDPSTRNIFLHPDILLRFKTAAGTVDILVGLKFQEMLVYRDGKLIPRKFNAHLSDKNSFRREPALAFIALARKALPDDPDAKAFQAPAMTTAELVVALRAAGAAYYDHYHALPATPENYVVIAALTGKTRDKQSFLDDIVPSQISLNGELLDEWGTPLRFVFTQDQNKPIEALSAGNDRIFGTPDDVNKPKPEDVPGAEGQ